MQLQVAIQERIQEFFIEAVQNLVQRGLLNLWQITSPPHPLPPGAKFNARFIKKISQLKSDIRGGGGWGIGSATAILAVCVMESQLKGAEKGKCTGCLE